MFRLLMLMLLLMPAVSGRAAEAPSPHWNEQACGVCHGAGKPASIGASQAEALCAKCHKAGSHDGIHPIDLQLTNGMRGVVHPTYASRLGQSQNRLSCNVCHDPLVQCEMAPRGSNPAFLRFTGASHESATNRVSICFNCHDIGQFRKSDPHKQLDERGSIDRKTCALCHKVDQAAAGLPDAGYLQAIAAVPVDRPEELCQNCHLARPHPADTTKHFEEPNEAALATLKRKQAETGITLPLDAETGAQHCATCHNPHQKGLIPDAALATGGDQLHKLRKDPICDMCHDYY